MVEDGSYRGDVPRAVAPGWRRYPFPGQGERNLPRRSACGDVTEDSLHHRCRNGVDDEALLALTVPSVSVRRSTTHVVFSALDPRPLAALRPLGDLEPLQLGHPADDGAHDLPLRAVVDVLGDGLPL